MLSTVTGDSSRDGERHGERHGETHGETHGVDAALLEQLALIEELPLDQRAAMFAEHYAELQLTLQDRDREAAGQADEPAADDNTRERND